MMMRATRCRGTALIFVLGVLALLSGFAISMLSVARLERRASEQFVSSVRASLAARAGVAVAVASLRDPSANGDVARRYPGIEASPLAAGNGIPLEVALSPLGRPTTSGSINRSDLFATRVLDAQGMVNLNGPEDEVRATLVRLGDEIARESSLLRTALSGTPAAAFVPDLGGASPLAAEKVERLLAARAERGGAFRSKTDALALGVLSAEEARAVRDYVTCHGDRDAKGRYPVNANTASRAVLVAVLRSVSQADAIVAARSRKPLEGWLDVLDAVRDGESVRGGLCFSTNVWEVESVGRACAGDGKGAALVAEAFASSVVRVDDAPLAGEEPARVASEAPRTITETATIAAEQGPTTLTFSLPVPVAAVPAATASERLRTPVVYEYGTASD